MPKDTSLTIRNDNLEDFYLIGEKIGDGHFAEVKLATCRKTNKQYAAKFILRKRQNMFGYSDPQAQGMTLIDIEREAKILAQLENENIIKLYEVFHHKDSVVLIIELVTGGELFARVAECERLSEEEASNFINQILYGVDHIHSLGIVHLDLKPENIMIEDLASRKIKLIDFGLARTLHPNQSFQDMAGTPEFCAPEIVNFDPITCATDMWAVGVITYILLTGISPFAGDSQLETFQNILDCYVDYDRPEMEGVSNLAKDFIKGLLTKNSSKRATANQCLQHPWIRPRDQKQIKCRRSSTIIRDKLSHLRQFVVTNSGPASPPMSPTTTNSPSSSHSPEVLSNNSPASNTDTKVSDFTFFGTSSLVSEDLQSASENQVSKPILETRLYIEDGDFSTLSCETDSALFETEIADIPTPVVQNGTYFDNVKTSSQDLVGEITVVSSVHTMTISDQDLRKSFTKKKTKAPELPIEKSGDSSPSNEKILKGSEKNFQSNSFTTTPTPTSSSWRFSLREKIGAAFSLATNALSSSTSTGNQSPSQSTTCAKTFSDIEEEPSRKSSSQSSDIFQYSLPMSALSLINNESTDISSNEYLEEISFIQSPPPVHRASLAGGGIVRAVADQRNRALSVTNGNHGFSNKQITTEPTRKVSMGNNISRIQKQFLENQSSKPMGGEKVAVMTTRDQHSSTCSSGKGIPIKISKINGPNAQPGPVTQKKFWKFG